MEDSRSKQQLEKGEEEPEPCRGTAWLARAAKEENK